MITTLKYILKLYGFAIFNNWNQAVSLEIITITLQFYIFTLKTYFVRKEGVDFYPIIFTNSVGLYLFSLWLYHRTTTYRSTLLWNYKVKNFSLPKLIPFIVFKTSYYKNKQGKKYGSDPFLIEQ